MSSTISPNMGLVVPTVGSEPGPTWAQDINADLGILDQHSHAAGQGVPITPAGLDINADLAINQNNLTTVGTVNFNNFSSTLAGTAPNLGCVYVAGGELVYNDESGNVVPITKTGSVNAGAGSITGLPSGTASASYSGGTFAWQSATNTPANMDAGSVILRNIAANSKGLTLNPPNAMAADYSLTLPAVPSTTSVLGISNSGQIGAVSGLVDSIGANNIANSRTRTTGQTVGVGGFAISGSSGLAQNSTNVYAQISSFSVTITTSGRPVKVGLMPIQSDGSSYVGVVGNNGGLGATGVIALVNGSSIIGSSELSLIITSNPSGSIQTIQSPSSICCYDLSINGSPGTYTYTVQIKAQFGTFFVSDCLLYAYEL